MNRIVAHLLEFRLYSDEPALLMRAQRDLLVANGAFLRAIIGPSLLLAVPFSLLVLGLHGAFAQSPASTWKARRPHSAMPFFQVPLLNAPPDRAGRHRGGNTAPPLAHRYADLLAFASPQIVDGVLTIRSGTRLITKSISAGGGVCSASPRYEPAR